MNRSPHIAVNTGGGDAPGLNAVIRAVVLSAARRGWLVTGIRNGYEGLLGMRDGLVSLDADKVRGITHLGGTVLGANNRGNPFSLQGPNGKCEDASARLVDAFKKQNFDALVAIGGDGSLRIAGELHQRYGLPIVGVPKTIDNDVAGTEFSFGFDSAVAAATEALDRLHPTAESHQRVMVVELMGRNAGWIALHAGLAGTADVVLLPEIPFEMRSVCNKIRARDGSGRPFSIVVVAEGAMPRGGIQVFRSNGQDSRRLGGIAQRVALEIERCTGKESRELVLGHLQRGGPPTAWDRLLSLRFGAAAVRAVERKAFGTLIGMHCGKMRAVPLPVAEASRCVPLDSDLIETARDLGICLGDD